MGEATLERAAVIALLHVSRKWSRLSFEILERGSALELLDEKTVDKDVLFSSSDRRAELLQLAKVEMARWAQEGIDVRTILDHDYPVHLRDIRELPPVLFTRGETRDDSRAIAVVGTRQPSAQALDIARSISSCLVDMRVTVVSGLAAGIDTAAHTAALSLGGRTVAVVGNGINRCYPASNRELQDRIALEGLLVSQFWPDAPPQKHQFLMRNETMSGYAAATVVVEAGEHSGTRHQANRAVEHGRQVILLDRVLSNEWARSLTKSPGVHVATNLDEIRSTVSAIVDPPAINPREVLADIAV